MMMVMMYVCHAIEAVESQNAFHFYLSDDEAGSSSVIPKIAESLA